MIDVDPQALPSVPLEERKTLPDEPGVYFVLDPDGRVVYIGRTASLVRRWRWHHRVHEFSEMGGARIAWLLMSDPKMLDEIEAALIAHFEPPCNGSSEHHPRDMGNPNMTRTSARMPLTLKEQIARLALNQRRSENDWMLEALEEKVQRDEAKERGE